MAGAAVGLCLEALLACPLPSVHDFWLCEYVLVEICSEPCVVLYESLAVRIASSRKVMVAVCAKSCDVARAGPWVHL